MLRSPGKQIQGLARRLGAEVKGSAMSPPLAGVLVLDVATLLPGLLASLMLLEAGAEVVKMERRPIGDEMRAYAPRWGDDGVDFAQLNRRKQRLVLGLRDPTPRAQSDASLDLFGVLWNDPAPARWTGWTRGGRPCRRAIRG